MVVLGFSLITVAPGDLAAAVSPQSLLARDRRAALVTGILIGLSAGLCAGTVFGLLPGLLPRNKVGQVSGLETGLAFGLLACLAVGFQYAWSEAAWPSYTLARGVLALRHGLPWPLMDFLEDAHKRGVLRQVGAVYQFRHIELQHRLATRPSGSSRLEKPGAT